MNKAYLVSNSDPGKHHIFIHHTCKILKAAAAEDYVTFADNLLQYFSVFVSRTCTCICVYDHTSRETETPTQQLKAPTLLVLSTADSENNSFSHLQQSFTCFNLLLYLQLMFYEVASPSCLYHVIMKIELPEYNRILGFKFCVGFCFCFFLIILTFKKEINLALKECFLWV